MRATLSVGVSMLKWLYYFYFQTLDFIEKWWYKLRFKSRRIICWCCALLLVQSSHLQPSVENKVKVKNYQGLKNSKEMSLLISFLLKKYEWRLIWPTVPNWDWKEQSNLILKITHHHYSQVQFPGDELTMMRDIRGWWRSPSDTDIRHQMNGSSWWGLATADTPIMELTCEG